MLIYLQKSLITWFVKINNFVKASRRITRLFLFTLYENVYLTTFKHENINLHVLNGMSKIVPFESQICPFLYFTRSIKKKKKERIFTQRIKKMTKYNKAVHKGVTLTFYFNLERQNSRL